MTTTASCGARTRNRAQGGWPSVPLFAAAVGAIAWGSALIAGQPGAKLAFVCAEDNDLYQVATSSGIACTRYAEPIEAVTSAAARTGVLILGDRYPDSTTPIAQTVFDEAREKSLRLYVEYPSFVPEVEFKKPRETRWERAVVASEAFGLELPKMRILAIHGCRFLPTAGAKPHLVLARVAGFDVAPFGLPEETWPVLFEHPSGGILVATTKLSQFVTARYGPTDAWPTIWRMVFGWIRPDDPPVALRWTPTVRPTLGRNEPLPVGAQREATRRGTAWYEQSRMLVHELWKDAVWKEGDDGDYGARPGCDRPIGDGRLGILEGHTSTILVDGTQPTRWLLRADCNAESALPLAFEAARTGDAHYRRIASNLSDFVYFNSPLQQGPRNDPQSALYGLLAWWCTYEVGHGAYYSNDNAKALVATLGVAALLDTDRWDEAVLRCILGHFRITSPEGFCCINNEKALVEKGWRHFSGRHYIYARPQHMAWIASCYLWLYDKTKYSPLLERTETALRLTMQLYPEGWLLSNKQLQMERARLLLALAWLIRVDDTPEHRAWLKRITDDLLAHQDACGAIQEQIAVGLKSNEEYGSREMALVQDNEDPVADMLYVMPNVLFGLREAAGATGDEKLARVADKAAEFLVRIQVRSQTHPEFDGTWFRAFDFGRWDYWAVNGDAGWGAWCTETGWAQSYILAGLALGERKTTLWELTAKSKIAAHFEEYRKRMQIDEAVAIAEAAMRERVPHLAIGKPTVLAAGADARYPGGGPASLVDGVMHDEQETRAGAWMGFRGIDLEATIDLGRPTPIRAVAGNFFQSVPIGVFLPRRLEVSVSDDGKQFRSVAACEHNVPVEQKGPIVKVLAAEVKDATARFVKLRAITLGTIPPWHPARGRPAWMFVDEITLR